MSLNPELVIVQHVRWEGLHRITDALADVPQRTVDVLEREPLPDPSETAGAVLMGGPMSVNDTAHYPDLKREQAWLDRLLEYEVPVLGVCLGAQLIASVLGAKVTRAPKPELGWAPVTVTAPDDPLVGPLAPVTAVLHWHGECFDTPPGAEALARSAETDCQAFRYGSAWGLLFHMEADRVLVEQWLAVEAMAREARDALGPRYRERLEADARVAEPELLGRSAEALSAFAALVKEHERASDGLRVKTDVPTGSAKR
jgi:GMP synthase (glutamine-hydrolysing)